MEMDPVEMLPVPIFFCKIGISIYFHLPFAFDTNGDGSNNSLGGSQLTSE